MGVGQGGPSCWSCANGPRVFSSAGREPPPLLAPVCRLPQPATASPTPGAGCFSQATPCQGRAGGVGYGVGALVLALTGVAYLRTRTGGSIIPGKIYRKLVERALML